MLRIFLELRQTKEKWNFCVACLGTNLAKLNKRVNYLQIVFILPICPICFVFCALTLHDRIFKNHLRSFSFITVN